MIPRNPSRQRIVLLCLSLLALAVFIPARTDKVGATHRAIQEYTKGFCASERDKPVVYFSKTFDVNITKRAIDTQPLVNAFIIHLKEEYDYKTNNNYPVLCPLYKSLGEAEAARRVQEAQARGPGKQIVEVDWTPPAWGQVLQSDDPNFMAKGPPVPTHTFCAVGHDDTMYFSGVFDALSTENYQALGNAFNGFLLKRYGFEPQVDATCTPLNTVREAEYNLKARIGGVRANNHKAVETGWKYDPTGTYKPVPKATPKPDDDPEPPQKQPRPAPATDARDFATKEAQAALAICQNDRVMSGAFDCYRVHRAVYNYRIAHAGEVSPVPVVKLLDKLDCSECIIDYRVKMWATSAAQSRRLQPKAADCVAERFLTNVRGKPNPGHANELFEAAIAACK
jgi:hypothetical protein